MFDLVRLSKLRVAYLRNGVIGVGETNIVNTGFVEGRAVDRTADVMVAVAQAIVASEDGYAMVSINGQGYMINVTPVSIEDTGLEVKQTDD